MNKITQSDSLLYIIFRTAVLMLLVVLSFAAATYATDPAQKLNVKDLIQEGPEEEKASKMMVSKVVPQDEYDRGTPRRSMLALGQVLGGHDYERAMNYLDMRKASPRLRRKGPELARKLKIIADHSLWFDYDTVSDDPLGHQDDGLPGNLDIIARLDTPDGPVDILLQRIWDGEENYVWKLSNRTVAEIPRLYKHYGYGEIGDTLSRILPDYEILGLEVWQWVMLAGIALAAYTIAWMITRTLRLILRLINKRPSDRLRVFIKGPVRFLIFVLIVRANFDLIAPTVSVKALFGARTLLILAVTWLLTGLVEFAFGRLSDRMRESGDEQASMLFRPAATLVKVVIMVIAFISWLDNLGLNVTAMLAGLGVGGIAVGLAAQKSIENLIGAITMYAAQPVRIGDLCRAGDTLGVVEEIGLRSTSLRTLERTLVAIPNANVANMDLENLTVRDKRLYKRKVRLRYDTTPDQIRSILDSVRGMLADHPDVDPDPARIRFTEFGESSLDLDVFAYIKTNDMNEYLASIEDLNLRILDIISAAGTRLAVPAHSVRVEGSGATS